MNQMNSWKVKHFWFLLLLLFLKENRNPFKTPCLWISQSLGCVLKPLASPQTVSWGPLASPRLTMCYVSGRGMWIPGPHWEARLARFQKGCFLRVRCRSDWPTPNIIFGNLHYVHMHLYKRECTYKHIHILSPTQINCNTLTCMHRLHDD